MITSSELLVMAGKDQARVDTFLEPLNSAMEEYAINTPARVQMFVAQLAYESMAFSRLEENLLYTTPQRIRAVWPKRMGVFTDSEIDRNFVRRPQDLANFVYASREGNGDKDSGDGWKYRGRGLVQLTFLNNYVLHGNRIGVDLRADPDAAAHPVIACNLAGSYWHENRCNDFADAGAFDAVTQAINGPKMEGQARREILLEQITEAMA